MPREEDRCRRGLLKLMLRMPALRGKLRLLSARDDDFRSLCGAFEEAQMMLERLRGHQSCNDPAEIAEYEQVCSGIENEIISMCRKNF